MKNRITDIIIIFLVACSLFLSWRSHLTNAEEVGHEESYSSEASGVIELQEIDLSAES